MIGRRYLSLALIGLFGGACWSMASKSNTSSTTSSPEPSIAGATPTPGGTLTKPTTTPMSINSADKPFTHNLPPDFEQPTDDAGKLLLREYGAVFVARGGVTPPKKVVFKDEADVSAFQSTLQHTSETMDGETVDLQTPAMNALKDAIAEARAANLTIGPNGPNSARRGYNETVTLWASRVNPGLAHWLGLGKITQADVTRIKAETPYEQVPEILKLEEEGIYFAKDLSKSIIYSVAPPGTSQHLSMLALDVKEFNDPKVRAILAKHGWFQTVSSDLPHFTFLGVTEAELPGLGLKPMTKDGRQFWVPDI